MWDLVERYTGRVGYERGVKGEGLTRDPPVVDCSGWVAFLLGAAMNAENADRDLEVFPAVFINALATWSDRQIQVIADRSGGLMKGAEISEVSLPALATIGLNLGHSGWETNHPRPRGINHIVQVVRRPSDGAAFVSEALGFPKRRGVLLTPLGEWLDWSKAWIKAGTVYAGAPFSTI